MPSIQCLQRYFLQTGVQVFSSPSVIYRYTTTGVKAINTQSNPNPSDFPMGKTSSVTAPDSLFRLARTAGRRTCSDCPPTIHFVFEKDWAQVIKMAHIMTCHWKLSLSDFPSNSSLLLDVVASGGFSIIFVKVGMFILKHLGGPWSASKSH